MVNQDIRRLQVLNDLIAQTLDVINQRGLVGGMSHTPYIDTTNPYQLGQFGTVPLMQPQSLGMGIGHTPFQGAVSPVYGSVMPNVMGYGQGIPNVFGGLMHTPAMWQTPYAQQMGQGMGQGQGMMGYGQGMMGYGQGFPNVFGGLTHTPFTWQTPQYGVGMGLPVQNPWMMTQGRLGCPQY